MRYIIRALVALLTLLAVAVLTCLGAVFLLERGPSPAAKRLFVLTVKETSAVGFLADIFLSDEEVAEILSTRAAVEAAEAADGVRTDVSLINIAADTTSEPDDAESASADAASADAASETDADAADTSAAAHAVTAPAAETVPPADDDASPETYAINGRPVDPGIEIEEVAGEYYNGVMMIVRDPKRVAMGTPDVFGYDQPGLSLRKMCDKFGAIAGINGGGFHDPNGKGTGGAPTGIVIRGGEIAWGSETETVSMIGFTADGVLVVGSMTGRQALDAGVEFGCSFGPALIVNGEARNKYGPLGGGLNPRTAIGQRADGAVLLLAINGRQLGSLGATHDDVVSVMLAYGAVNASNLDGGASTLMMYDGETLNNSAYVYGERVLATAFLVLK